MRRVMVLGSILAILGTGCAHGYRRELGAYCETALAHPPSAEVQATPVHRLPRELGQELIQYRICLSHRESIARVPVIDPPADFRPAPVSMTCYTLLPGIVRCHSY